MCEEVEPSIPSLLSTAQIETFLRDGVLVVDNILTPEQLDQARHGLKASLGRYGVDTDDLLTTGTNLTKLSSTNGSGGVLDLIYEDWKLDVALNEKLFQVTTLLWQAAFCHEGESRVDVIGHSEHFKWHPFGKFDCNRGYVYLDRVGFRLPTIMAEQLGNQLQAGSPKKATKRKHYPMQRSLTPHLDCCPETFLSPDKTKWRPIQCMVSLTDSLEANTGGFEAAKGFHREFEKWTKTRPPSQMVKKIKDGKRETLYFAAPCVGEYTHIRPTEDAEVMKRVQHVPMKAGSAVFWDNRIPHANAYRHEGCRPRCVVYCSFLPDVPVNRTFVAQQLSNWKQGRLPVDTKWMQADDVTSSIGHLEVWFEGLTMLQRRLLGMEQWQDS
jgi:hypothetical protein